MAPNTQETPAARWALAVARLPWWAWALMAIGSFAALHALAGRPQAIVVDASQLGAALPGLLLGGLLSDLQLFVPPLCLVCVPLVRELVADLHVLAVAGEDETLGMSHSEFASLTGPGLRRPTTKG